LALPALLFKLLLLLYRLFGFLLHFFMIFFIFVNVYLKGWAGLDGLEITQEIDPY
jgi:hypothetical protein